MSILALNKVNYSYTNGKKILNNISMEFEKGKFYTILGVSGSGKTTLLSLLAGLDEPQSGKILYNNQDIREKGYENHRKNNVSLIFQNYNLIDYECNGNASSIWIRKDLTSNEIEVCRIIDKHFDVFKNLEDRVDIDLFNIRKEEISTERNEIEEDLDEIEM